jgi:myo-inositol-1(or 4)-monophosphatase
MAALDLPTSIADAVSDPEARLRLAVALAAAREAGALLIAMRPRLGPADRKGRVDLVTEADRASERLLLARLSAALPEDCLIGEEGASAGPPGARWRWYMDPVDGTTNFVTGLPHFAVSLGGLRDGVPTVGVVSAPALGTTWLAATGGGAWRLSHAPDGPAPVRLAVSPATSTFDVLAATGFPYDRSGGLAQLLAQTERAVLRCLCLRRLGSASLDLALVADGVLGLYWEAALKPWDYAAGVVLVREAGGRVTDHAGRDEAGRAGLGEATGPLGPDLAASNGHLHAVLLGEIIAAPRHDEPAT